jgi:2-polyprenyl-3-methyl-5-hydroxy-6-metoxy-1,4-benzoquinol methylase
MTRLTQLGYTDLFDLAAGAIGLATASNILVAGCGGGQELVSFSAVPVKDKRTIVGVDPSEPFLAFAKQRVESEVTNKQAPEIKYVNGYVHDLPEPGKEAPLFDAATSMYVLHHCADDDSKAGKAAHLNSISKRMKAGAKLFLVDTVRSADESVFKRQIEAGMAYQAIRGVPVETTHQMAKGLVSLPMVTEARTMELLAAAGVTDVLRLYSAFHVSGWVATKKN